MSEIPRIGVENVQIQSVGIYGINTPPIGIPSIPVANPIGFPVVNIPGCVAVRKSNRENANLVNTDKKHNVYLCVAQYPSYEAMDYVPEELVPIQESKPQRFTEPETPAQDTPPTQKTKDCPPPDALEVGTKVPDGKGTKEITGYQLIGNRCVTQYSEVSFSEQITDAIPSIPQVVQVGSIAIIATASAAATPALLRIVKPLIKQVVNRVKKILGKKVERPNLSERRTIAYREKKGLPPLKKK